MTDRAKEFAIWIVRYAIAFAVIYIAFQCDANGQCGSEKIEIKDLCDKDTAFLHAAPVHTTVKTEGLLPKTAPRQLITLTATITAYKIEADGDIHAALVDNGAKMISEFPNPDCPDVKKSSRYAQMKTSREWFLKNIGTPSSKMKKCNVKVTLMGQRFIDKLHGQFGAAPNGVEIHAVLKATKQ